jgi:hypothetical protein
MMARRRQLLSGKNLVNVKELSTNDITLTEKSTNSVHKFFKYCNQSLKQGVPVIHHYTGTEEQFYFRNDMRSNKQRKQWDLRGNHATLYDASLSWWIGDFIQRVGIQDAIYLLDGVGQVGWQRHLASPATSTSRTAADRAKFYQDVGLRINMTSMGGTDVTLVAHGKSPVANVSYEGSRLTAPRMHVLMGLSGSKAGFFSEIEVALKSVILNAPLDRDLQVHFMADRAACESVLRLLRRIEVQTWTTRNEISFVVYNVESHIEDWADKMNGVFEKEKNQKNIFRHTIGAYFRLFANEILGTDVENVLYMDSDAVIMANLEELWRVRDAVSSPYFSILPAFILTVFFIACRIL